MDSEITVFIFFLANVIYCVAYLVRDILWLRVLTIIGALCTFPYFIFQHEILYSALFWQSAFAIINIINIIYLLWDRKPIKMTAEQHRLHSIVFRDFSSRNVVRLMELAEWREGEPGQLLIEEDRRIDKLYLVYSGLLVVSSNGKFIQHLRDGEFVGELSYILRQKTSATVEIAEQTRYLAWDRQALTSFIEKNAAVEPLFKNLLNYDIATKLSQKDNLDKTDSSLTAEG